MADTQYGPLQPKHESASDIRKVIANATKETGKGFTIANNDELKEQKEKKEQKQVKVSNTNGGGTATKTNTKVETPKTESVTVKEAPQGPTPFPVIDKSQLTGDIFKNPQLQGIKDIPTFQEDNQAEHNVASRNNNDESFMNTFGRATELKKPVDVDNALMDLFVDVRGKVKSGTLAQSDVVKMKELYPEFANMGDDVILSMIGDMASMASKNMPFNNENMAKFKSLYPELTAASWGFDKGSSENMYQAGGMREQMASTSATDLNKYGTAGAVAEGVMNPLGEITTLADMGAQMIPQVDGSGNENRLKKALSKLTDEDINKYYEQYQNYVKNHGTLSNLYTLQLEGDTVVEQLWNWATGKGKKDVDAGFRDWLIDRVNNEVNGWAGEVTGAANDLKGVGGPNIAKMYANLPASTIKTITAITRAITNPVDTAAGLYHLFGTEEGRQALIARYGSWDGFAKALEQDPVGVASDGLAVIEGGAGLTKMATGGLSKASLLAGLSTEALGAARTTENLLKLATRLENIAIKAGKIEKTAGLASNLGADLPINKVINGLRTWGESGESLIKKVSKYTANNATTGVGTIAGKVVDTGKDIIKKGPISSLADLLMGSATDSDKLFKAASPNINRLSNNVDYKNKRAKMDLAEQAIVDAGYLPKSISEWAKAHTETLNKKWNEFKQMVADKGDVMVDVKDILKEVKDYIKSEKDGATELQKQDLRKLEVEVAALERMGKVDMNFIEKRKEHYNSSWRDSDKLKVGDVYLKGIKMIGNAMRKQQDNILGKGPESTKKLRSEIAALMDTKNDVIKADIKNQKRKSDISGGGLVESYGRLSGLGDVIGGVVGGVLGKGGEGFAQAGKGIGKMVLGKAMGRAKDVDYLTKKGFEGLSKKKKAQNSAGLQSKFKDSKELGNLYVERDNLRKELKKDNISDSRKEAINKRLDDIEYAIAQKKARAGLGDKERVLSEENKKKVIDMVSKRAKDVGFTTEVLDGMEKDTQGYTDLRKKLIALEKNPGDTTAQHELFHAFFSVVDNKTKTYILDEAKKILKESGMKDVNAEEWLAESFGIYAKRKQIKLGLIDAPKGFVAKVRNFFQKVYEFMQRFNGDRATINKVFDEVLGDRQMKNGIIDLSDLLGDKEVKVRELGDNGLRNKKTLLEQKEQTNSPEFKRWFGDWSKGGKDVSKVVNADGTPKVVYHGTANNFTEFKQLPGYRGGLGVLGEGFYFTDNKGTAKKFSKEKTNNPLKILFGGKVMETYLDIKNPYEVKYSYDVDIPSKKELKAKGYDGIVADMPGGEKYYVAFEPNQIKSATDNVGTFDKNSNDIRYKAVYHGSPADFDKFDSSHMGEGEGNQAHGWGHYVAVKKGTAHKYAELNYVGDKYGYKGQSWYDLWEKSDPYEKNVNYKDKMAEYVLRLQDGDTPGKTNKIEDAYKLVKEEKELDYRHYLRQLEVGEEEMAKTGKSRYNLDSVRKQLDKTKKELDAINELSVDDFKVIRGRNLYNLEIPDPKKADTPTGSNYLEEKKLMSALSVQEFVDKFKERYPEKGKQFEATVWSNSAPRYGEVEGWEMYRYLEAELGSPKAASKFLESLGYDGIHYYGARDGEAYVIFNDDALQIKDHIRYKKKIGDKDVEITPKVKSPDELIEKNADGLSVMKSFISEKQAEKALNVNKVLLDKDGNPYLWTHTNKYDAPQFANFENTKDSKYKEFADREIAWFSNSEEMSRSYADSNSKLADTKPIKSIKEFNEKYKNYDPDLGKVEQDWHNSRLSRSQIKVDTNYEIKKVGDEYVFGKDSTTYQKYKNIAEMYEDSVPDRLAKEGLTDAQKVEEFKKMIEDEFINTNDMKMYDSVDVKNTSDGVMTILKSFNEKGRYKTEQEALAKATASMKPKNQYHYQGIITDVKNPLVIDLGKYGNGEIRYGKDVEGKGRYWNDLGSAYDFLKKNEPEQFKKLGDALEGLKEKRKEYDKKVSELDSKLKEQYDEKHGKYNEAWEEYKKIKDSGGDTNKILEKFYDVQRVAQYWDAFQSIVKEAVTHKLGTSFSSEQSLKFILEDHPEWRKYYDEAVKIQETGLIKESQLNEYLENNIGINKAMMSMLHGINPRNLTSNLGGIDFLKSKELQTNDIVFYALNKGGYDGVLFKDIVDYGGKGETQKGGDVLAAFQSKDFKAWDNANPTDSKYISYKKKVSLDKKSEGLSKKDSNGLLAKGRERTLGNDGLRYKTNISDKDSSGKKLSEGQKEFFAGSKVVDKDGNLLRVYHGTNSDYTVYDKKQLGGASGDLGFFGDGWYFATHKGEAKYYGNKIMEGYLDIKNPFYFDDLHKIGDKKLRNSNYVTIRNLAKLDDSLANIEVNGYKVSEIGKMVDDFLGDIKLEKLNDAKDPYNGWDITYWKVTKDGKSEIKESMKGLSEDGMLEEQLNHYMMDKVGYIKSTDVIEELTDSARFDKSKKSFSELLQSKGHDGVVVGDSADKADEIVAFNSNQFKNIDNKNPTKNEDIRFKKVYHGGGDFDKFDLSHAGEGEGNSAHGHGIYVTENKSRAEQYGNLYRENQYGKDWQFSKANDRFVTYKGKKKNELGSNEKDWMIMDIIEGMQEENEAYPYYDAESQIARMRRGFMNQMNIWSGRGENVEGLKADYENKMKILDSINPKDFKFENPKRNLYDVEIPDPKKADTPTGTNYLEEGDKISNDAYKGINKKFNKETGLTMKRWSKNVDGKEVYDRLTEGLGSKKKASEFLNDMGYDGIHYVGKQDGSSYVIFNDKGLDIKDHIRYKKQIDTPEFKKWFEGSKVVDKDGKPLVAYHGTHGDFTIFDKEKIGSNTNNEGLFGKGFYFTTDSKYGDYYKGKGWSKDRLEGKTMQVYLDIKNPFMWNDYKGPQAIEKLRKELKLPKSVLEWNNYGDNGIHVFTKPEQSRRFTEALEKAGYDGVWFKYDNGTQDEIVAFNTNQIKSATDNIGTFDKNNPDIRYKKGLEKKSDGLEKKKTSTASSFQGRVDAIANELGVKGGNTVQKMKRINKIIKEDKYKGTDVKKRFYQLKWEYKKQYIINNDKKIKDKGFKKTTIRVWQNGKKADWHFTKKQYDELKELGYIVE